ncbi:MAG: hypothetical protein KAY37_02485 [Phycisphaerae bacterium]|nr:hypothetical protein [Phycisphaerae bacterium]
MNRSGYRKLILGGLIAGLGGWGVVNRVFSTGGATEVQAATAVVPRAVALSAEPVQPAALEHVAELTERDAPVPGGWPPDPFFRLSASEPDEDEAADSETASEQMQFVVDAIISGTTPLAVINGEVVAVGGQLSDGSTVTAIESYSVTLRGAQGEWTLKLSD